MVKEKKTFFYTIAGKIERFFPELKLELIQADIHKSPQDFLASCLQQSFVVMIFVGIIIAATSFMFGLEEFMAASIPIAVLFFFVFFLVTAAGPRATIKKKVNDIESNLAYAVKSIRIHLTSGAPLFEVFINVGKENYGELSATFRKAVKEINMGRPIVEVLEEVTERTPSIYFKNAMWPLIGGLKTGGDLIGIMDEVSKSLSKQQINQATQYGGKVQSISMITVVLGIVAPCIGMVGTVIGSMFMGFTESMVKMIFYLIVAYVVMINGVFIVLINAHKPSLVKR